MRTRLYFGKHLLSVVVTLALPLLSCDCLAQGNAFTYQGRLTANGNAANGSYDLRFILYTADIGGSQVGPVLTNSAVSVASGLFATTLDFGSGAFTNGARWLEIAARTNGVGSFTPLNPRQPVTPAPQSIYALQAGSAAIASSATVATTASGVPWAGITGMPAGFADGVDDGASFSAGTGLILGGAIFSLDTIYTDARYWKLGGNSGTTPGTHFLGTADNQALEFKVNNQRALRVEPSVSPNLIGGHGGNAVGAGVSGATIGGGGYIGATHMISSDFSTISGGWNNTVQSSAAYAVIGGGYQNTVSINAFDSSIGGGTANTIEKDAWTTTIGGGSGNRIQNKALAATIAGGDHNLIGTNAFQATIGGGQSNVVRNSSSDATIAGGWANTILTNASQATIAGGAYNAIEANCFGCTIGGGWVNTNRAGASYGVIAGGLNNAVGANSACAMVPGGTENVAAGNFSFAAGRRAKANHAGAFVWGDSSNADIASSAANQFTVRAAGGVRLFSNSTGTAGVSLAASGTSWGVISDKNAKKNFAPVDGKEVLEKLASVSVEKWNYKWEADEATPHMGPMAQDFKATFFPGRDDKSITTLEFDGVELAAIQGLNQKLTEAVKVKDSQIAELEKRLGILESLILHQNRSAQ